MAKVYGALIGAPAQNAGFVGNDNFLKDGFDQVLMRDRIALPTTQAVGDTISLGSFRSGTRLSIGSRIVNDALGGTATLSIGDATYPAGLAAAFSVAAAGSGDLWKTFAPAKMGQPLWQALGYPADPGGNIELLATLGGSAPGTAGSVAWQLLGHQ